MDDLQPPSSPPLPISVYHFPLDLIESPIDVPLFSLLPHHSITHSDEYSVLFSRLDPSRPKSHFFVSPHKLARRVAPL